MNAFFESTQTDRQAIEDIARNVASAYTKAPNEERKKANDELLRVVEEQSLMEKMEEFDATREKYPMFKVMRNYMNMVMEMLQFIRAILTADWRLHLQALCAFTGHFFAPDRLNYARMTPLYLAEMDGLPTSDPEIYAEFFSENWVGNKNPEPEMARLAKQAKEMAGVATNTPKRHHKHTSAVESRETKNICALCNTIIAFTNPFTEDRSDLYNLVAKVVMPHKIKEDLCNQPVIGQTLFDTFAKERIQTGSINVWSKMKKRKLATWKNNAKKVKVSTKEKLIELQEDRSLFARMMMVCRSRTEIDLKETVGIYEFAVVPRSMFAPDGSMLQCTAKSPLMAIPEKTPLGTCVQSDNTLPATGPNLTVIIIDGMAELQGLSKPGTVRSCAQLADHFIDTIKQKYGKNAEVRLIFDRYDVAMSL